MSRRIAYGLLAAAALTLSGILVHGYKEATADPVIRSVVLRLPGYPANISPMRIVLFSDLHVHGPDMPPARVARIVQQINALRPDIAVAAGDFVGDSWIGAQYPIGEAVAPLAQLRARLGVYAVLGNNDWDVGASTVIRALRGVGVHVLVNQATAVGPIALGGIDGRIYGRKQWRAVRMKTYEALRGTPGIQVLVAHRPDEFKWAPQQIGLVLAGHTHCGQIVLPVIGPMETGSDFGRKYLCGIVQDRSKVLIVTAGLGSSHLPVRIGAPPDIWVISIEGAGR
jgi:predicted MPP superfamily phosphohydrolase